MNQLKKQEKTNSAVSCYLYVNNIRMEGDYSKDVCPAI